MLVGMIGGGFGWGLSVIIRIELGLPGYAITSSLSYNSVITFHGIYMIFFMIMPLLIGGFGNCLVPLLLCTSDMIFPRLNALSLWVLGNSLVLVS
jgi:heme/copper-type cytochrome/quinol oxidase subunit 1